MRQSALVVCLLGLVTAMSSAPAGAQASRTWVSGVGNDASACSREAPCKTFAAAFAATATGGEISVLDPGAYGTITIDRSITINNDGAGEAAILGGGTHAITINSATADVTLRGLVLRGGSSNGIQITAAGQVSIEKCVIQNSNTGLNVATNVKLKITDTAIFNNTIGMNIQPASFTANVAIERSRFDSNIGNGLQVSGASGGTTRLSVADSSVSLNSQHGVEGRSGPGYVLITLSRVNIVGNTIFGVLANGSAGSSTEIVIGNSLLTNNPSGATQAAGNAYLYSTGNNQIIFKGPASLIPISQN